MSDRTTEGDGSDGVLAAEPDTPFLVAASLSGVADAAWARRAAPAVDAAVMGGIALDTASRRAARELVERDRSEFLPRDPIDWIDDQLAAVADAPLVPGVNVRSATVAPIREAARVCADHGALCEINAHCRQPELRAVGCGESLLADRDRLVEYVTAAVETGAVTSVKVRTEVSGVDLVAVADSVAAAGAEWLHVDAMDSESVIAAITAADPGGQTPPRSALTVIANNEVRGRESVAEYAQYGADAVSVGRPSENPTGLTRVADAVDAWRAGSLAGDGPEDGPNGESKDEPNDQPNDPPEAP